MMRRSTLILVAVFVVMVALIPGVAVAGDPIPPTGHWTTEDPDSTSALPSIDQLRISVAATGTDDVRVWLRDNRATGACATTQGPAEGAGVFSYDAATGDLTGTSRVWCLSNGFDTSFPSVFSYDQSKDELIGDDGVLVFRRVAEPVNVGLVDVTQGLWMLQDGMGSYGRFFYGNPGDFPILGDWNCNGVATPGMYRQSDGFVYLRNSNTQGVADIRFFFGDPGDIPIAGDFNADGCDTVSIYRPSNQTFYIINELGKNEGGLGAADFSYVFGNPGDKPFVGDFNGNGEETVGLHRESTGLVYYRNMHTTGNADNQFIFGDPNDRLVAGDWIDDGTDTPGLFRPSNTTFYLKYANTQGNANDYFMFGNANSVPVAGPFGALSGTICDMSYPDFCIPPSPPDLSCSDIPETNFTVLPPDLHGFDSDNDGIGCET
jgi:hypothetical protein